VIKGVSFRDTLFRVRAKTWQGCECLIRLYARPNLGHIEIEVPVRVRWGASDKCSRWSGRIA